MDTRRALHQTSRYLSLILLTCVLILAIYRLPYLKGYHSVANSAPSDHMESTTSVPQHSESTVSKQPALKFQVGDEIQAFLGRRRDAHTLINATNIFLACQGEGPLGYRDTRNCLNYLLHNESSYLEIDRSQDFRCDSDDPARYHTYWRGPLTWRVSFMLKSWLFTQNLKCSRIFLWLDGDFNSQAVEDAMKSSELASFLPLVDAGMIVLKKWIYPAGVYIPPQYQEDDFNVDNMLYFPPHQIPRGPVAVSDSVRFIILHQEGGLYLDMDTMFLRDLRPLLITPHLSFAERWGAHAGLGEYNTAYLRLQPNSSLSSRILQGAAKMGVNFHPRVLGRMLAKTGHHRELLMFETALFDPLWSEFDKERIGFCCTPCLTNFAQFFEADPIDFEWQTLSKEDIISETLPNRTLSNFYRGAYTHHIHNQWRKKIRPGSWVWVADESFNQFFLRKRPNPYGEMWKYETIEFHREE